MTVQANLPPTNTNSDGTTTTFNYGFKVTREEHLKATYTVIATGETGDLEIDSVTGIGDDGGGTVTFATAPADGMIVTVDSIAPLSQIEAFTGNKLPPATVERMGDAITIQNQRQQSQIERSVRFPASDDQIPTLPAKAQRADKILGFTPDGSDFAMIEGAAASQAYVDQAEAQADRAVAAASYPYTSGEQKTGAFMPGTGETLTLFTYNAVSDAAVTLPALSGLATGYNIGICRTAGSGDLTISAGDGALINGAASVVLASDYLCLDLTINEAGDEWVAQDKALIGLPVGPDANNVVALDGNAKLPAVDGSQLLNVRDDTARDTSLISYIKSDIALNSPGGVYGRVVSDNFIADTLDVSTGATYNATDDYYTNEASEAQVSQAAGTAIGDASQLANAFDGVTSQNLANSANKAASTSAYVGKSWGGGNGKKITKYVVYPSSSDGFTSSANNNLEIRLYGSASAPSSPTDGTQLHSTGTITDALTPVTVDTGIDASAAYEYHWLAIIAAGSGTICFAEIQFFETPAAANMTLQSAVEVLDTSDPTDITLMFRVEDIDTVTNGTDRSVEVSIDNGSTWAPGSAEALGAYGADDSLVRFEADVSGQTGNQFKWRMTTSNNKAQRIKQVAAVPEY